MRNKPIILLIFVSVFLWACGKDVAIYEKNFSCDNGECIVKFEIQNSKYEEIDRKIYISLTRQRNIGKGAVVNDMLGEKSSIVHLKPNEKKVIEEPVKLILNKIPSMLIINDYPVK